jgi:hypothetical protein
MKSIQDIYLDYSAESNENPDWLFINAQEYLLGKEGVDCYCRLVKNIPYLRMRTYTIERVKP